MTDNVSHTKVRNSRAGRLSLTRPPRQRGGPPAPRTFAASCGVTWAQETNTHRRPGVSLSDWKAERRAGQSAPDSWYHVLTSPAATLLMEADDTSH